MKENPTPFTLYTEDEIKSLYRGAKYKKKQLEILAQLNCCSINEIKRILGIQEGYTMNEKREKPKKPDADDYSRIGIALSLIQTNDNDRVKSRAIELISALAHQAGTRASEAEKPTTDAATVENAQTV